MTHYQVIYVGEARRTKQVLAIGQIGAAVLMLLGVDACGGRSALEVGDGVALGLPGDAGAEARVADGSVGWDVTDGGGNETSLVPDSSLVEAGLGPPPDPTTVTSYLVNPAHTSAVSDQALHVPLVRAWTADLGAQITYPLIANGRVYVIAIASTGQLRPATRLSALDVQSGHPIWGPVDTGADSSLALDGDRIFTLGPNGDLRAFDAGTGAALWERKFDPNDDAWTTLTAYRGIVYATGTLALFAFDEATGEQLWSTNTELGGSAPSPTVADEGVFVSYDYGSAYAFDRITGSLLWRDVGTHQGGDGATSTLFDGRLYTRAGSPDLVLDAPSGRVLGTFQPGALPPAFAGTQGFVVFTPTNGVDPNVLAAFDIATLKTQWTFRGDGALHTSPLVVDDEVYVASPRGVVFGVDRATGTQNWSDATGAVLESSDTLAGDMSRPWALAAAESHLFVPAGSSLIAYSSAADAGP